MEAAKNTKGLSEGSVQFLQAGFTCLDIYRKPLASTGSESGRRLKILRCYTYHLHFCDCIYGYLMELVVFQVNPILAALSTKTQLFIQHLRAVVGLCYKMYNGLWLLLSSVVLPSEIYRRGRMRCTVDHITISKLRISTFLGRGFLSQLHSFP